MPQSCATSQELAHFKEKAEQAGFTPDGLYVMLVMLNLHEKTMTIEDIRSVWPYLNEINARKFSHLGEKHHREKIDEDWQSMAEGEEGSGR
jgi:hypothetical protein